MAWSIGFIPLAIASTEVDKLFAEVNLFFIWVLVKLLKLSELPLALLSLLFLATLFLFGADLSLDTIAFLS